MERKKMELLKDLSFFACFAVTDWLTAEFFWSHTSRRDISRLKYSFLLTIKMRGFQKTQIMTTRPQSSLYCTKTLYHWTLTVQFALDWSQRIVDRKFINFFQNSIPFFYPGFTRGGRYETYTISLGFVGFFGAVSRNPPCSGKQSVYVTWSWNESR